MRDSVSVIEQGYIEALVDRRNEVFYLLSALDKAASFSISILVSSWILRLREYYLSFIHSKVSPTSKARALYDKLDFNTLFNPQVLSSFLEENKVQDSSELTRWMAMALNTRPRPKTRPTAGLDRRSQRFRPFNRPRQSRPFRGSRGKSFTKPSNPRNQKK